MTDGEGANARPPRGPYDNADVNVVVREREARAARAQEASAARGRQLFALSLLEGEDEELLDEDKTCPVCLEPMNDPVITACKHVFCKCSRASSAQSVGPKMPTSLPFPLVPRQELHCQRYEPVSYTHLTLPTKA